MSPLGYYGNNMVDFLIDFFCSDFWRFALKCVLTKVKARRHVLMKRKARFNNG